MKTYFKLITLTKKQPQTSFVIYARHFFLVKTAGASLPYIRPFYLLLYALLHVIKKGEPWMKIKNL